MQSKAKVIVLPRHVQGNTAMPTTAPQRRKYRANKFVAVVVMMFVFYATIAFVRQEIKLRELRQEFQVVASLQQREMQEQAKLKEDLEFVRSDEYIERAAREKLGYLRVGDLFYIVNNKGAKQP